MTTIADAVLPDESDPEDQDFEGSESSGEAVIEDDRNKRRNNKKSRKKADKAVLAAATKRAATVWEEMQAEESAASLSGRGPCGPLSDPLWRQLQCRHSRPPKQRSQNSVLAELAKYRCGIEGTKEATEVATAASEIAIDLKRRVRGEVAAARQVSATIARVPGRSSGRTDRPEAAVAPAARSSQASKVGEPEPVRRLPAAEPAVVPAAVPVAQPSAARTAQLLTEPAAGPISQPAIVAEIAEADASDAAVDPASDLAAEPPQKRRRGAGQLSQLGCVRALLTRPKGRGGVRDVTSDITLVEKADKDWQAHKERIGVDGRDLARDRTHSGALERKAFLARTAARTEAVSRASARALARQKVAAAARLG